MKTKLTFIEYIIKILNNEIVEITDLYNKDRKRYNPIIKNRVLYYTPSTKYSYKEILLVFNTNTKQIVCTKWNIARDIREKLTNYKVYNIYYDHIKDLFDNNPCSNGSNSRTYYSLIRRYPKQNVNIVLLYECSINQLDNNIRRSKYISNVVRTAYCDYSNNNHINRYNNELSNVNGIIKNTIFDFYIPNYQGWSKVSYDHIRISPSLIFNGANDLNDKTKGLSRYNSIIDMKLSIMGRHSHSYNNIITPIDHSNDYIYVGQSIVINKFNNNERIKFGNGIEINTITLDDHLNKMYRYYRILIDNLNQQYINELNLDYKGIEYILRHVDIEKVRDKIVRINEYEHIKISNNKEYYKRDGIEVISYDEEIGLHLITTSMITIPLTYVLDNIDNTILSDGHMYNLTRLQSNQNINIWK